MKFRFDALFEKAQRLARKYGGDVSINLPFITVSVKPDDIEKKVARELMVRLPDKRVLNSKECCDSCIDRSLASIQEIRKILVEKQVELSHLHNGGLYLLIEYMAEGIRQFLTDTEHQEARALVEAHGTMRPPDDREQYFSALQQLRFHIHSCLLQVAKIAGMETPKVETYLHSSEEWNEISYIAPTTSGALEHEPQQAIQGPTSPPSAGQRP
ncbi:hypothetical protein E4T66_20870 [Sinimarinibacterium sp. CAU 1509]|uniref:hypothetical protein n=1 Tax=Sinimarinibacterium sp. CAU 1509 TaxID=2562283 RepID=UPI0010ACB3E4|nr:hypothetical protein [Sinimarinibacterium sp. CAU 1509]TJY55565.1 hypothetical protein E4T66_20870 [Sinimarinibacterium sp. CAU 1509]